MSLLKELKRRNVFRIAAAYVVVAWLLIQVSETIFPLFGFNDTPARVVVIMLAIGFVPALIFAWVFELTPEGLKKDQDVDRTQSITPHTGKKLDSVIMIALVLALGYFSFDKFVLDPARDATLVEETTQQTRSDLLVEGYGGKSIAVLPFSDMSEEGDQEYFSDGISEELLNLLAKIPELRVISRTSAFSFKGQSIDIPSIAEQLNVAHILEGSVRTADNKIRIAVKLIDARSDTQLWSESYDRNLDDIFSIQDEIAAAVVDELKITLVGIIPEPQKTDPEVYSLFLKGKYFGNSTGEENPDQAVSFLEQALAIDPNYAPAWVAISEAYESRTRYRYRMRAQGIALARDALERALAIDDSMAIAWSNSAYLKKTYDWDWQGAEADIDKALRLEPNNADVIGSAASLASSLGQLAKSIELFERAVALDPLGLWDLMALGNRYRASGRFDEALDIYDQVLLLEPEFNGVRDNIALTYLRLGKPEQALAELDKAPAASNFQSLRASILFMLGKKLEAQELFNEFLESSAHEKPFEMATMYAWRGDNNSAFDWLETAYAQRERSLSNIMWNDELVSLESDPRYLEFLEKLGLLEYWEAMPR